MGTYMQFQQVGLFLDGFIWGFHPNSAFLNVSLVNINIMIYYPLIESIINF